MEFLDARRLTGPNLIWKEPGSILDIACTEEEADRLLPFCETELRRMLDAVGWGHESIRHRCLEGGVSIVFSAPIDALYAASAINEWLWARCNAEFNSAELPDFDEHAAQLNAAIAQEVNPPLLALEQAAAEHGVAFLWDDDDVSVGHGYGSKTWPFRELPDPESLDWKKFHDVPVGIVTGTNGKTTTVRIARQILMNAGRNVGMSCTDWISVNDRIIDRDDWSGPGGARTVLRQQDVEVAILETARGGLLRRGLGINKADAALITNIAEDHLGDFGSRSLAELLNVKWVVSHAVAESGILVLNADDPLLVEKSKEFAGTIAWFSLNDVNPVVVRHTEDSGIAYTYSGGGLVRIDANHCETICSAAEISITLDGVARHNIANCLAAAALVDSMGFSLREIAGGLLSMSQDENPGRSSVYEVHGFNVLVDFAHNPQAMQALFSMAEALPAKRRVLAFGQAGDRTDEQIRELARSAWSIGLEQVNVAELKQYARGREEGEVFRIIRDELLRSGARDDQIRHFDDESQSFDAALDWAAPGDLVVLLDLGRVSNTQDKIAQRQTKL